MRNKFQLISLIVILFSCTEDKKTDPEKSIVYDYTIQITFQSDKIVSYKKIEQISGDVLEAHEFRYLEDQIIESTFYLNELDSRTTFYYEDGSPKIAYDTSFSDNELSTTILQFIVNEAKPIRLMRTTDDRIAYDDFNYNEDGNLINVSSTHYDELDNETLNIIEYEYYDTPSLVDVSFLHLYPQGIINNKLVSGVKHKYYKSSFSSDTVDVGFTNYSYEIDEDGYVISRERESYAIGLDTSVYREKYEYIFE